MHGTPRPGVRVFGCPGFAASAQPPKVKVGLPRNGFGFLVPLQTDQKENSYPNAVPFGFPQPESTNSGKNAAHFFFSVCFYVEVERETSLDS